MSRGKSVPQETFLAMVHGLGNRLHTTLSLLQRLRSKLEESNGGETNQLKHIIEHLYEEMRATLTAASDVLRNARPLASKSKANVSTESDSRAPIKVLWVDDDALHMSALRGQFEDAKWQLTVAPTVKEGLRLVGEEIFDGVMLDQIMPPEDLGMEETAGGIRTGLAVARRIRETQPSMPIVFFTIANTPELNQWCRENPPAIVIAKPSIGYDVVRQAEALIRNHTDPLLDELEDMLRRFPNFVKAVSRRHADRPGFALLDEYDVQDLLRGLLSFKAEAFREEEWTPSYAGASSRIDFVLSSRKAAIEVKMTRPSMTIRELGDQLLVDIARYGVHPDVRSLVCFIVDAANIIHNREALIRDFRSSSSVKLEVRAIICDLTSGSSNGPSLKARRSRKRFS